MRKKTIVDLNVEICTPEHHKKLKKIEKMI